MRFIEVIPGKGLRTKNLDVNASLPEHILQETKKERRCSHPGSSMNFNSRSNSIQEQAFRTQVNSKNNLGKNVKNCIAGPINTSNWKAMQPNPPAAVTAPRLSRLKIVTVHMQV